MTGDHIIGYGAPMIYSQGQDLDAQSDQGNDGLIALAKSLDLDSQERWGNVPCERMRTFR